MVIAGKAIGATHGIVYLRGEYRFFLPQLMRELETFHKMIKEIGFDFTIRYCLGSGAISAERKALIRINSRRAR